MPDTSPEHKRSSIVDIETHAGATLLLAVGIPVWRQLQDRQPIVEHEAIEPEDHPGEAVELAGPSTPSPLPAEAPTIKMEPLTDEMLLAQLDAAGLPYWQAEDGAVHLIETGFDPWRIEDLAEEP